MAEERDFLFAVAYSVTGAEAERDGTIAHAKISFRGSSSMGSRDDAGWERFRADSADSGGQTLNGSSNVVLEGSRQEDNHRHGSNENPGAFDHPQR